jgi:hypothetical protein
MYLCARGINFVSFDDFSMGFWNNSTKQIKYQRMKLTYVLNDTFFIPELHGLLILNVKKYFNILIPINTLYIVQVYANFRDKF